MQKFHLTAVAGGGMWFETDQTFHVPVDDAETTRFHRFDVQRPSLPTSKDHPEED